MGNFQQIQLVNLREHVIAQIRNQIIEGGLKPNDHIVESAITSQLGVSRTPVREALILLEREGLVVSKPNRGFFVREFEPNDIREMFSMRATLENFAAELVVGRLTEVEYAHLENLNEQLQEYFDQDDIRHARRADMAFHQTLIEWSQHGLLIQQWEAMVAQIAAALYVRAEAFLGYDEQKAIRDHKAILAAYRARDLNQIIALNREINISVAAECCQALESVALDSRTHIVQKST